MREQLKQPEYPATRRELMSASWDLATENFKQPDKRDYQDLLEHVLDGMPPIELILGPVLVSGDEVDVYRELEDAGVALYRAVGRFAPYEKAAATPEWKRLRTAAQAMVDTLAPWRRRCLRAAAAALASEEPGGEEGTPDLGAAVASIVEELPAKHPEEMRSYVLLSETERASYERLADAIHALVKDVGDDASFDKAKRSERWATVREAARKLVEAMSADGALA